MVKVTDGQRFHPTSSRFGVANQIICPMIVVIDSYCMFLFSNVLTFKQVIQKVLAVLGSSWFHWPCSSLRRSLPRTTVAPSEPTHSSRADRRASNPCNASGCKVDQETPNKCMPVMPVLMANEMREMLSSNIFHSQHSKSSQSHLHHGLPQASKATSQGDVCRAPTFRACLHSRPQVKP